MANASRDENNVTTLLGVSSVDAKTPVTIYANPTTHRLLVESADGLFESITVTQSTLGDPITTFSSTASGDDPIEVAYQNKVTTTDATQTTIATIPIPASTTVMIEARVVARRTGGSSGSAEDSAAYIVSGCYKNVGGTATEVGEGGMFTAEDQATWACTFNVSGSNALLQVTGAANNNISWVVTYRVYSISS